MFDGSQQRTRSSSPMSPMSSTESERSEAIASVSAHGVTKREAAIPRKLVDGGTN
jgi:hypothetical protein